MQPNALPSPSRRAQAGFSLLEMLVSISILSAVAYVALDAAEMNTGQIRYDKTERRLEIIRKAIVGDPNRTANGAPVISGFVADVGRLPRCLEALIEVNPDCDEDGNEDDIDVPPLYGPIDGTDLSMGWRGPYFTSSTMGLSDAWGNRSSNVANFGWEVTLADDDNDDWDTTGVGEIDGDEQDDVILELAVQTLGRNRQASDPLAPDAGYDVDYQLTPITSDDFLIPLSSASITFEITAADSEKNVCIVMLAPAPADDADDNDAVRWDFISGSAPVAIAVGNTETINFSSTRRIPFGLRPLLVLDANASGFAPGTCDPALPADAATLAQSATALRTHDLLLIPRVTPSVSISMTVDDS